VERLCCFVLQTVVYFFEVLAEIKIIDGDIVLELNEVAVVERVHRFEVVSLVYLVTQHDFEVILDGLEEIVYVDILESLLPDWALEVLFAEDVHLEPQLIGIRRVTKNNIEETYTCFFLLVSLLLIGIFPLCLILYAYLHVQSVEILHAAGC